MAIVKPFRAIRPDKKDAAKVASLPYDVFSEKEARDIVKNNPESFLKIVRPETVFPEGIDIYAEEVYDKARQMLDKDIEDGVLIQDQTECYYIYRQMMSGRIQTGIVAGFSVDDYLNNVIKKHEFTRHDKEADRIRHITACGAQTGLVFLAYDKKYDFNAVIERITAKDPEYDFISADDVRQIVWKVQAPEDIKAITEGFAEVDSLYIADGHHRCESAAVVAKNFRSVHDDYTGDEEVNYIMAVAFPNDQLLIYPYNRVVKDLNGFTDEEFIKALEENGFTVNKLDQDFIETERKQGTYSVRRKGEIAMCLSGDWYRLNAKPEIIETDAVGALDVSLLQRNVLSKLLGIDDPRSSERIEFVGGIRGFEELERRCAEDMKVAFSLYPTSMRELFRVTDEGQVMPPKSTWFEPKLQSGLFVHEIL